MTDLPDPEEDRDAEMEPTRLDLRSADVIEPRIDALAKLFPEAVKDGKLDVDSMRAALGDVAEHGPERFGLTWPGKGDAIRMAQRRGKGTLVPMKDESVDWASTKNVIIEGENLEVLKLLQRSYHGKVKLIYIDPPYNTGKDFVYPDNFREPLEEYLRYSGQVGENGGRLRANAETGGRYHSAWLSMMWPRLHLARSLLREDGVLVVSIDDVEAPRLRMLLDEIFGEENFVAQFVWQKKYAVSADDPGIGGMHDYLLAYARSDALERNLLPRTGAQDARYKNPDDDPRGPWTSGDYTTSKSKEERPTLWYAIRHPRTAEQVWPEESAVWRFTREKHEELEGDGRLDWGRSLEKRRPRLKRYLSEVQQGVVPSTWLPFKEVGHNDEAQKELARLIGPKEFSTPKPVRLLRHLLAIFADETTLACDFFAGSGTLGDAVMRHNLETGSRIRHLSIQLPEAIDGALQTIALARG